MYKNITNYSIIMIFLIICGLAFLSPYVYDDFFYSHASYNTIGVNDYINSIFLKSMQYSKWAYFSWHGRPGTPMHTFFIHFPILWSIFVGLVVLVLYLYIPFIIVYKRMPTQKKDYRFILFSSSVLQGYSILFPYQS